jgi:hypothetical protein
VIETSWLIGSTYVPSAGIVIDGVDYVFPAGHYYLRHTTAALSLIATLDGFLGDAGITGHTVYVARDRKVRIGFTPGSGFTLVWPTALRELFGFTANIPATDDLKVASQISVLLWSAGKPHSPQESPFGVAGRNVYDTRLGTSPDGTQVADSHHVQVINQFAWNHVAYTRFQTSSSVGGEYVRFFDAVLRHSYKFYLYAFVSESLTTDDTAVTWPTSVDALGPYGYRPTRGAITWDFQRSAGHQNTGRFNQVSLDCLIVLEWGAV